MIDLPICSYRTILADGRLHCGHNLIKGFPDNCVPATLCQTCVWKDVYCGNPRKPEEQIKNSSSSHTIITTSEPPKTGGCGCGGSLAEKIAKAQNK